LSSRRPAVGRVVGSGDPTTAQCSFLLPQGALGSNFLKASASSSPPSSSAAQYQTVTTPSLVRLSEWAMLISRFGPMREAKAATSLNRFSQLTQEPRKIRYFTCMAGLHDAALARLAANRSISCRHLGFADGEDEILRVGGVKRQFAGDLYQVAREPRLLALS